MWSDGENQLKDWEALSWPSRLTGHSSQRKHCGSELLQKAPNLHLKQLCTTSHSKGEAMQLCKMVFSKDSHFLRGQAADRRVGGLGWQQGPLLGLLLTSSGVWR